MRRQKGRIQIPLHKARTVAERMPALAQRLFDTSTANVVKLTEPGLAAIDFGYQASDIESFALEFGDEHAGRLASKRLAPESGKTTGTMIFDFDVDGRDQNPVGVPTVTIATMTGGFCFTALLPGTLPFIAPGTFLWSFDTASRCIKAVRITSPAGAIKLATSTPDSGFIDIHLVCEVDDLRLWILCSITEHCGYRSWTKINTNRAGNGS